MPRGTALRSLFEVVRADPTSPRARVAAERVLRELSGRERPSAIDVALLADHAEVWSSVGFADHAQALLRRWRARHRPGALERAEAVFVLSAIPPRRRPGCGRRRRGMPRRRRSSSSAA